MFKFSNLRLSTRIYAQQAFILSILVVVAGYSLYSVSVIQEDIHLIRDVELPLNDSIVNLNEKYEQESLVIERLARQASSGAGGGAQLDELVAKVSAGGEEILDSLDQVQERIDYAIAESSEGSSRQTVQQLAADFSTARARIAESTSLIDEVVETASLGQLTRLEELAEMLATEHDGVVPLVRDLSEQSRVLLDYPIEEAARTLGNQRFILIVMSILAVVLGIGLTIVNGLTLRELRIAMKKISEAVQQVASASSQSSNAISMVADGSKQQAEAIGQAVTAVDQTVSVVSDVSKNAEEATENSKAAANTVRVGEDKMEEMVGLVRRISENSAKINKITDVINNISNQTNMLSLNAAIEAARAGEQGKGFAVVAEQVRKLAEGSRNSVQDIVQLINQATEDADLAVESVGGVREEIKRIGQASDQTENSMRSIATAMEEQVATTEELQQNMDTMKGIGEDNSSAAEEITQTIMELSRISDETNEEVSKFRI